MSTVLLLTAAQAQAQTTLTAEVAGLASGAGEVSCVLWRGADGFPNDLTKSVETVRVKPRRDGVARCTFTVQPGGYAISMTHDENGNGRFDKGLFGIPTERYGFSRDPRPLMRAPRFDEASLTVGQDAVSVRITAR